jgi:NAD-dependent deacetylase
VALQDRGQLYGLITQNVDGLHQLAGVRAEHVIEVHGTMHWTRCWTCDDRDRWPRRSAVVAGRRIPIASCAGGGREGILKSDTISFGQNLVPEVIERAFQVARGCDLLLAVGSTLQVYPVAGVVPEAKVNGARVVIVNARRPAWTATPTRSCGAGSATCCR